MRVSIRAFGPVLGWLLVAASCFAADGTAAEVDAPTPERHRGVSWVAGPREVRAQDLEPLVANGVNWIVQTPFGWQERIDSPTVKLVTSGRVYWGERDEGLEVTTRLAKERGIKTLLKPHIWISRAEGKWRSDIAMGSDEDWRAWFDSYGTFILHYARLAERLGIEALCIGTELRQTVIAKPDEWRRLIVEIRKVYSGQLTYAGNWWREFQEVAFWDELDYIGIQAYFPLGEDSRPSVESLKRGWAVHLGDIVAVHERFGKPVLFTEIGYKSAPGSTVEPWKWPTREDLRSGPVDLDLQANAYRAFFEVFWNERWFAGVYFWKWFPQPLEGRDGDFTPQGKPAEKVMAKWFGGA
jgi:hypothetical protein